MSHRILRLPIVLRATASIALTLLVHGCGVRLADVSAMYTGCRADDIDIVGHRSRARSETWVAICRGQRFQCGYIDTGRNVATHCTLSTTSQGALAGGSADGRRVDGRVASAVRRTVHEGIAYLTVEIDAGRNVRLRISAAPRVDREHVWLRVLLTGAAEVHRACPTAVLIDGVPRETRASEYAHEDGVETLRFVETLASLREIAGATRVAGRVCDDEWRLDAAGQAMVAELIARFEEELAWTPDRPGSP